MITIGMLLYTFLCYVDLKYHESHPHVVLNNNVGKLIPGQDETPFIGIDNTVTLFIVT